MSGQNININIEADSLVAVTLLTAVYQRQALEPGLPFDQAASIVLADYVEIQRLVDCLPRETAAPQGTGNGPVPDA